MNKNIIDRVWDALDYSADNEWFKEFTNGNLDLRGMGAGEKLVFVKFDGEDRFFSVADLGRKPIKGGTKDKRLKELVDATAILVSQYLGLSDFEYDRQQFMFWDYDGDKKHYWLLTSVRNIITT